MIPLPHLPHIEFEQGRPEETQERIDLLERQVNGLKERLIHLSNQTADELQQLKKEAKEEREQRVEQREKIKQKFEDFSVGGLTTESIGFVCLTSGLLLTSLPNYIASLLSLFGLIH